jgi:CheY-like chemotaxis protein
VHAAPTLLVIDPHRPSADALQVLLRCAGWQVDKAYDGLEAIRLADLHPPDVVFCDLKLQGSLGAFEVARLLREHPEQRHVRLVGTTTMAAGACHPSTARAYFDEILQKPLDSLRIEASVRTHWIAESPPRTAASR